MAGRTHTPTVDDVLVGVCARLNVDHRGARLIQFTNSAVYRLASRPLVVRIAGSRTVASRADKIVAVAHWLAERHVPAVRLLASVPQPMVVGGRLATVWHAVDRTRPANGTDLAKLLGLFHQLRPPTMFDLPTWAPTAAIRARLAEASSVDDADLRFLRSQVDEIEGPLAQLIADRPTGPIHGDANLNNVIAGAAGPVLSDFDSTSLGPREWDLVPTAVGMLRFGYPPEQYRELAAALSLDIMARPEFPLFRRVRELTLVTSVIPNLPTRPELRDQWRHRLRTFRRGDCTAQWQPYAASLARSGRAQSGAVSIRKADPDGRADSV